MRHICAVVVVREDGDEVLSLPWLWLPWIDGTDPSPFLVGCIATLCHSRDEILIEQLRQTQLDSSDQRNPCDHHEPNNRLAKPRLYTPFWVFVRFCCSFADDRPSLSLSLHRDGHTVKSGNRRRQPPETPAASPRVLHHGGRWSFSLVVRIRNELCDARIVHACSRKNPNEQSTCLFVRLSVRLRSKIFAR